MAIQIDPALQAMPQRMQDEFRREVAGNKRGPIADAVLPLNEALIDRQRRIDALTTENKRLQAEIAQVCEAGQGGVMAYTAGECFQVGEVWQSPRGTLYKVMEMQLSEFKRGARPTAILRLGQDGKGKMIRREWDAINNWTIYARATHPKD